MGTVKSIIFRFIFSYYNRKRVYSVNEGGYLPEVKRRMYGNEHDRIGGIMLTYFHTKGTGINYKKSTSFMSRQLLTTTSIVLIFLCLFITGCGSVGICKWGINEYQSLIQMPRNFLVFCLFLVEQRIYWGQMIGRLYYAYFHLANIIYVGENRSECKGHSKLWKMIEPDSWFKYALKLKLLRDSYDYSPEYMHTSSLKEDLTEIVKLSSNFNTLLLKSKGAAINFYNSVEIAEYELSEGKKYNKEGWIAEADIIFGEVYEIHAKLINEINKFLEEYEALQQNEGNNAGENNLQKF